MKVSDLLMVEAGGDIHCLVIADEDHQKMTILTLGSRESLRHKMREVSEVLHISGDKYIDDQSRSVTGYPMIRHEKLFLQVIPASEAMDPVRTCDLKFFATGEHLG